MQQDPADISRLIYAHLEGELSAEDQLRLEYWLSASDENRQLFDRLTDPDNIRQGLINQFRNRQQTPVLYRQVLAGIDEQPPTVIRPMRSLWRWGWVAAALITMIGTATYILLKDKPAAPAGQQTVAPADIPPGREGAILTLADGTRVLLDSLPNGVIAAQNGSRLSLQDGRLAYDATGGAGGKIVYNTMTTPRGRQFQLSLPDGTRVWLNAASAIRYPTAFSGQERTVELTGEAWFQVAPQANRPFQVKAGETTAIEVLGTGFNVNAYSNEEAVITTLVEGAVRVQAHQQSQTLAPGQQAAVGAGGVRLIPDGNIEQALAWKNGVFNIEGADLKAFMRQLERWYAVDVVYEGTWPPVRFRGEINRGVPLSEVLQFLQKLGIKTTLQGNRLRVGVTAHDK